MSAAHDLMPTRASLLGRLRDWRDEESWRDFFSTYWKLLYGTAIRAGLSDAEAQDVVQETVISVSKSMPGFEYNPRIGSFRGWLLKLTNWRITDQLRRRKNPCAAREFEYCPALHPENFDPVPSELERIWDREYECNLVDAALCRVKGSVEPKHYQIFDLYVLKEWAPSKIAAKLGVSSTSVYVIKHRVQKRVESELASLRKRLP